MVYLFVCLINLCSCPAYSIKNPQHEALQTLLPPPPPPPSRFRNVLAISQQCEPGISRMVPIDFLVYNLISSNGTGAFHNNDFLGIGSSQRCNVLMDSNRLVRKRHSFVFLFSFALSRPLLRFCSSEALVLVFVF